MRSRWWIDGLDSYRHQLLEARGLAASTINQHLATVTVFLAETVPAEGGLQALSPKAIEQFVIAAGRRRKRQSIQHTVSQLHAWSMYAACALVLAYFIFRRGMPGMISMPILATLPASRGTRILGVTSEVIAVFALVFGPTAYIMEAFINSIGDYLAALPAFSFRLWSYENDMTWTNSWTLTYLIWWVAWGPFVGIFIARISRGRTIREFCLGVIVLPTVFSLFWFAALGGTGI